MQAEGSDLASAQRLRPCGSLGREAVLPGRLRCNTGRVRRRVSPRVSRVSFCRTSLRFADVPPKPKSRRKTPFASRIALCGSSGDRGVERGVDGLETVVYRALSVAEP
jgi:hypothetical protein